MRKAAKTLVAGTLVAIPLQLLWCAAATSQTPPPASDSGIIKQVNLGDVFAGQTINVVTEDMVIPDPTIATANVLTTGTDTNGGRFDAKQVNKGDVRAATSVTVGQNVGLLVTSTAAYGNAGDLVATGGANMSGGLTQKSAKGATTEAETVVDAYGAQIGDASVQTNAVANTQGIGIDGGGTADMIVDQKSGGFVHAATSTTYQYSPGTLNQGTIANANNITATGTVGSSQVLQTQQKTVAGQVLAYGEAISGNAQTINNSVAAAANNLSASNDGGPLDMASSQKNKAYVRAQAMTSAYEFGSANGLAVAAGNSFSAGETGVELVLDLNQTNKGGVDAVSEVQGNTGYDISSTATAMGNSATGYACSSCGGTVGITSRQVNSGDINATSTVNVGGSGRSVSGVSMAVGNSATYYSSRPGGN